MSGEDFEPWTAERVLAERVRHRMLGEVILVFNQHPEDLSHRGPWGIVWCQGGQGQFSAGPWADRPPLKLSAPELIDFLNEHRLHLAAARCHVAK